MERSWSNDVATVCARKRLRISEIIYESLSHMLNLGFHAPREEFLYLGFEEAPARPDDPEAFGMFIVERKPNSALITIVLPLIFMSWFGVFGTLIPKESGEKLRFVR